LSGIAGVFNRNGCDVSGEILSGIMDAGRHRGPDACAHQTIGPVGLCQFLMATTPEAEDETRPLLHADSSTAIVFDGRVDNRDDLIALIESHGYHRRTDTDMEIVLLCWLLWNTQCVEHILGDFAFAIWDGRQQTMFLARDVAGVRPLHYYAAPDLFIFATDICQILSHQDVVPRPNEGMIGEVLCSAFINQEETLYTDVFRLRPAHFLQVGATHLKMRQFWRPSDSPRIRYRSIEDYADHFREIFSNSIECRLRCNGPLGASLSGGFDSSLIVGMAQSLLDGKHPGSVINTYSLTLPGHPNDEFPRIDAMVRKWGLHANYLPFKTFEVTPGWTDQARRFRDLPEFPTLSAMGVLQRTAAASGIRVLLSGDGAGTWLGGTEYPYLGMLLDGKWTELAGEFRYQLGEDWRRALTYLVRSLCWPMLPRGIKRDLESRVARHFRVGFLPDAYQTRIRLQHRLKVYDCADQFRDLARWSRCFSSLRRGVAFHLEMEDRTNAGNGVEERHPFLDRRLITFACGIPDHVNHHKAVDKVLVRKVGKQFWPERLYREPTQMDYFRPLIQAIRLEPVREAIDRLSISIPGWISRQRVQGAYEKLLTSIDAGGGLTRAELRMIAPLLVVWAVETWYHENLSGV